MRAPSASACFRVTVTDMYGNVRSNAGSLADATGACLPAGLAGEYVDEVASAVAIPAQQTGLQRYAALIGENRAFFDLCRQRAASYWNAYYRARYPSLRMFPAHRLLLQMERAARSP